MGFLMNAIIFIVLIIILFCCSGLLSTINNTFLFHPYKAHINEWNTICDTYKNHIIPVTFKTNDNLNLHGALINSVKLPDWSDTIFLFSHGNGGWIGSLINYETIQMLSKFGSIFIYDYRGYGCSDKYTCTNNLEEGIYSDCNAAWKYLTNIKKIDPNNIIIYGHSLGAAVSSKIVSNIIKENGPLPRALIIEAPFTKLSEIAKEKAPILSNFAIYEFDNEKNLEIINGKLNVMVLHSRHDEIIPHNHSTKLKHRITNNQSTSAAKEDIVETTFLEINGSHNGPNYPKDVVEIIEMMTK
jgi:pimeloyl-ACP methyl ester carboxylesterase